MHLKFWKALINSGSRWKCIAKVTDNAFSMVCPINGHVNTKLYACITLKEKSEL